MTTTGTSTIYDHMFRSFGLAENPFHMSPDPRFFCRGSAYETAVAELMFGIESRRGLLVLTGEAGTGKTTLIRQFLQWLKDRQFSSSYIFHTHLHSAEMFEFILRDFGVEIDSSRKTDLLAALHRWLHDRQAEGDSPVIVIDEAQALSPRTLGELNLLLNLENTQGKLVQIVLAGQPELEEKLRRPELRALRQRIMVRCRLPLLSLEETREYIASRLRIAGGTGVQTFPPETVQTVYSYARGIPRIINLLCEQGLVGAYADRQATVSPENVRRVASEFDLAGTPISTSDFELLFSPPHEPARTSTERPGMLQAAAAHETCPEDGAPAPSGAAAGPVTNHSSEIPGEVVRSAVKEEQPAAISAFGAQKNAEFFRAPVEPGSSAAEAGLNPPILQSTPSKSQEIPERFRPKAAVVDTAPALPVPDSWTATLREARNGDAQDSREHVWRKHHSPSSFRLYWRDVAESFVRDWSRFFASLAPQASAFAGTAQNHAHSSIRRKIIEPLGEWLRKPVNRRRRSAGRPSPPARAGKS